MKKYKKLTTNGLLAALAIAISALEGLLPSVAFLPPGSKPGLSNVITMYTAKTFSVYNALVIVVLKAMFVLVTRGFTAFLMSLAGGVLSTLVAGLLLKRNKGKNGYIGIGVLAAVAHNTGQILIAYLLTNKGIFYYLPYLIIVSVATGSITGILLHYFATYMEDSYNNTEVGMKGASFPKRPFSTKGGLKIPDYKNTAGSMSLVMPAPEVVRIPLSMHMGYPCEPLVKVGDEVAVGQKIGDSNAHISAPIHASVSGVVSAIGELTLPSGDSAQYIEIKSDGKNTLAPVTPPKVENLEEFLAAIRESGLVGLGGAGFPTHAKLKIAPDKDVDTLIINAAECEPFITSDNREILENSWSVMSGIYTVKDMLGIKRLIIGVEKNKPEAIKQLTAIAESERYDPQDRVKVLELETAYPQGAEKMLIRSCTGRRVAPGKLPCDVGCLVMNVTSVSFVAEYLKTGMPLVSKRVTVDGSAIANPQNVIVPIGTSVKDVIEFCGGYKVPPKKIVYGGPMMGIALSDDSLPIMKQVNAVLAFDEEDSIIKTQNACIRCGKCIDNCPMGLMPVTLDMASAKKDEDRMKKHDIMYCIECGSCSFVCPAHRHLLQSIRVGKQYLKKRS